MIVTPVSVSPCSMARWIGAAPRYFGRMEPWTFRNPCFGISSSAGGRIFPYATTMPMSGAAARMASSPSRIFGGWISGNPSSFAFTATAGDCIFIPRPAGLSGCATTRTISCSRASASSVGTAKSGVPRKTIRKAARLYALRLRRQRRARHRGARRLRGVLGVGHRRLVLQLRILRRRGPFRAGARLRRRRGQTILRRRLSFAGHRVCHCRRIVLIVAWRRLAFACEEGEHYRRQREFHHEMDEFKSFAKYGVLEIVARRRLRSEPRGEDRVGRRLARQRPLVLAVDLDGRPGSRHVREHETIAFRDRL